jgi:hypothetical protein
MKKQISDLPEFEGDYPITIGNDYVGYREFLILTQTETLDTNSGFTIGLSVVGVVIVSIGSLIRKRGN